MNKDQTNIIWWLKFWAATIVFLTLVFQFVFVFSYSPRAATLATFIVVTVVVVIVGILEHTKGPNDLGQLNPVGLPLFVALAVTLILVLSSAWFCVVIVFTMMWAYQVYGDDEKNIMVNIIFFWLAAEGIGLSLLLYNIPRLVGRGW